MEQTKVYNGLSDVVSEIGGVGSSIQMVMGFLGFGFILFYVIQLTKLIRRKNEHQVRKAYINRNKIRLIRIFKKKIKALQSQPTEKWDNKLLHQY
jgi:large-conductance mechanosensitive channel